MNQNKNYSLNKTQSAMTLIKRNQEPKPNRNYPDYFYRDDYDDVADSFSSKVWQVVGFLTVLGIIVLVSVIIYEFI